LVNSSSTHFEVEIVDTGPRLHVINLRHSAVNISRRDDDVRIISVLAV